jgi:hypothetical protein
MASQKTFEAAVGYFASRSHDAWREQFLKDHPDQAELPRMRMRGGKMVDINQPWTGLDPAAQADNKVAAYAAYDAIERFPKDREKAAAYVHKQWIKRNRDDPNQPQDLFKPYKDLPENEKDKDRAHIDRMKAAIKAVSKTRQRAKAKKAEAQKKLRVDESATARLEAAAARLSEALGRDVTAEELLSAGIAAVLTICESAAPAKRRKKR